MCGTCYPNNIINLRKKFWGDASDAAPTQTRRNEKMREALLNNFNHSNKSFTFTVGGNRVCERGYLILLGFVSSNIFTV